MASELPSTYMETDRIRVRACVHMHVRAHVLENRLEITASKYARSAGILNSPQRS